MIRKDPVEKGGGDDSSYETSDENGGSLERSERQNGIMLVWVKRGKESPKTRMYPSHTHKGPVMVWVSNDQRASSCEDVRRLGQRGW